MRKKRFVRPQALRSASQDRLEETQRKPSSLRGVRTSTWGCFYCGKIEVHQLNTRSLARDQDRLQVHNSRLSRRVKNFEARRKRRLSISPTCGCLHLVRFTRLTTNLCRLIPISDGLDLFGASILSSNIIPTIPFVRAGNDVQI